MLALSPIKFVKFRFKFRIRNDFLIYSILNAFAIQKTTFCLSHFISYNHRKIFDKGRKMNLLQKAKNKLMFCLFFLFNSLCFAANPLSEFKSNVDKELNETMKTIMGMANTVTLTIGIAWLVILFLFMKGSPERFKENMKGIIIVSVIIGIAYGITYAYK